MTTITTREERAVRPATKRRVGIFIGGALGLSALGGALVSATRT